MRWSVLRIFLSEKGAKPIFKRLYDLTVRRENRACLPDLEVRTSVDSDLRYPCTQGTEAFLRDNSSAEHSQPFVKIVKELLVAAAAAAAPRSLPIR
jgi:hypothetical protein